MAIVDPTDLNPLGTEIIHVTGCVGGSVFLLKKLRVKSDANLNVILNGPERKAGRSLLLGEERTCRTGGSRSQFDPEQTFLVGSGRVRAKLQKESLK
jgi:hypothetical protein